MLLGRLSVRGKLGLLVLIPLVAMLTLTVSNGVELGRRATRAADTASAVHAATVTAALIRSLQTERLLAIGVLRGEVGKGELLQQQAEAADRYADVRSQLGARLGPKVVATMDAGVVTLDKVRAAVLDGTTTPAQVLIAFNPAIGYLIDSTHLIEAVDGNTVQGREVVALDASMRVNEGFDALFAAMGAVNTPAELGPFVPSIAAITQAVTRFNTYGTPEQVTFFQSAATVIDARLGPNTTVSIINRPASVTVLLTVLPSFPVLQSLSGYGRYVESKIITDVTQATRTSVELETGQAIGFGAISLLTILIALLLGGSVIRAVTRPLARLTASAERVARLAESELVRVADDDEVSADPVRLAAVDVAGRDEIADLARVFERVQETAARLVERQVAGRRNVALMFGHVGRRTQNLVGRQLTLIDRLAAQDLESGPLQDIARLDQVASRLRRSATSLVVLSGAAGTDEHTAPLGLRELFGLSLDEIEDAVRVDLDVSSPAQVTPALINDLALLLAELMDNAVSFSPPTTRVLVTARTTPMGARVEVIDHGLGLTPERLIRENARLAARERLDLAPTEVLGLFVVGRLARRHGLTVSLSQTRDGGVTAVVDVPARLLTSLRPYQAPELEPSPVDSEDAEPVPAGRLALPGRSLRALVQARPRSVSTALALPGTAVEILAQADPAMFDVAALDRASRSLSTGRSWNAFAGPGEDPEEPDDLLTDGAPQDPGLGWGEPPPARAAHRPALPTVDSQATQDEAWGVVAPLPATVLAVPHTPAPAGWGEGTPEPGWSTAITPGQRHQDEPASMPATMPASVPAPMAATMPVAPARPAAPAVPAGNSWVTSAPAPARTVTPEVGPGSVPRAALPTYPPVAPPQPFVLPTVPVAPGSNLNRRVPGATLSALEATTPGAPPPAPQHARAQDAEAVRESFAQFESGVARAMREVDRPDEGSP